MKRVLLALLFSVAILLPIGLNAQPGDPEKGGAKVQRADAEGTHFIVGFMQNEENTSACAVKGERDTAVQRISIASRKSAVVNITYPNGTLHTERLKPFEVISLDLVGEEYECLGEGICKKSFEITSDESIFVYCFSSKSLTSDGCLALPISAWGTEYVTANYNLDHYPVDPSDISNCNIAPRPGEFAVIAAEDNTVVTIYPKTKTLTNAQPNQPTSKKLMKGEMWQVQDGGKERGATDLTGSRVVADKPVGLLSGHVRGGIPWTFDSKDHLLEMLPPIKSLGTQHIVVPFSGRNGGDVVRMISGSDGQTKVTVTSDEGNQSYTLSQKGTFEEITVSRVTAIESDKPLLVAHYSQSKGIDQFGSSRFDPYMVVTTPVQQFAYTGVFQTMPNRSTQSSAGSNQFDLHYVTLTATKEEFSTLRINGLPLSNDPRIVEQGSVPGLDSEFVYVTLRLSEKSAFAIEGGALFSGYVYGIGEFDSYGWPVGTSSDRSQDLNPPLLSLDWLCSREHLKVQVSENRLGDRGIAEVNILSQQNVVVDSLPLKRGSLLYEFEMRLSNQSKPGRATLVVTDLAGNSDTLQVELRGVYPKISHQSVTITGVKPNEEKQIQFIVSNPSDSIALLFRTMDLKQRNKGWSLSSGVSGNQVVEAGDSLSMWLKFRSSTPGTFRDTLHVTVDCYEYLIPLEATVGGASISHVDTINFGPVWIGTDSCKNVVITNLGSVPLTINSFTITGGYAIETSSLPSLPLTILPGDSLEIVICFVPEKNGRTPGTLLINSDDAERGTSAITLSGSGIDELSSVKEEVAGEGGYVEVEGRTIYLRRGSEANAISGIHLYNLMGVEIPITNVQLHGGGDFTLHTAYELGSGGYVLVGNVEKGRTVAYRFVVVK
ncbi:MAG: choice-of-anchor D domain-containing protein [Ignavibacteriae bacterium]|nr:choice-of-anchor D domain-containing protein [Ignavibacteriota bacterium]MCB9216444.1 choice-of-anchor D domain-containing protein [Ignavibacteria bacterium]